MTKGIGPQNQPPEPVHPEGARQVFRIHQAAFGPWPSSRHSLFRIVTVDPYRPDWKGPVSKDLELTIVGSTETPAPQRSAVAAFFCRQGRACPDACPRDVCA